jgi:type IX secretion system substrate protein/fibronectin type III domain protein
MKSTYLTLMFSFASLFDSELPEKSENLGHFFQATENESDYYYTTSWQEFFVDYCYCNTSIIVVAAKNSFQSGLNWWTEINASAPDSKNIYVGPGKTEVMYITVYYNGEEPIIFPFCNFPQSCATEVDLCCTVTGSTAPIYPPENVIATDGEFDTSVSITWSKGTDIPDNKHKYRIYRDGVLIHTTADGDTFSYTDSGLEPGSTFNYAVTTYTDQYGVHESSQSANGAHDNGSTFGVGLIASDGSFTNRTNLKWNDLSQVSDEIRIERSIPETVNKEEIAILSKNATSYNDQDGIPGYNYTYYVTPILNTITWETDTDTGYSPPNGKISGHVRSQLNAGVAGVEIEVELLDVIPSGGLGLPVNCNTTYCDVTDAEGYYEIPEIYYYTGADFRIVPNKGGMNPHEFSPDTVSRTLDENTKVASGVDFTDLTVFTVGGRVTYPESSNMVTCGVEGVNILLDGQDVGIRTDANGDWSFAVQDEKTYEFEPEFLHHDFENPNGDPVSELTINGDNTDIDFEDVETDDLTVIVQGGCEASLGDSVEIHLTAPGNCFDEYYHIDANGYLVIYNLPARDYSVEVTDIWGNPNPSNIMAQIGNLPMSIDLTVRDTMEQVLMTDTTIITPETNDTLPNGHIVITPADTMVTTLYDTIFGDVTPRVQFTYRSPLVISTNFEDSGADIMDCPNSEGDNVIIMERGISYQVVFEVKELLGVDCYIDTGFLKIYDFVSDREGTPVKIPIIGGYAIYQIDAGEPLVVSNPLFHDHEKLLYIIPEVDLLEAEPVEYWILVTGVKSNTPSFVTRTPEIPMVVLHDPPGDNSYSFIEQGTSLTHFLTTEVLTGGEGGIYVNLMRGITVKTAYSENAIGINFKLNAVKGYDSFNRDGLFTTITFNERFSTSQLENLTGNDGDVFIGAAFNEEYSLAQQLTFDTDSCKSDIDIVPALSSSDFATTFVYTEKHIRNTLLPTLGLLKENILDGMPFETLSDEDQAQVNNLIADSLLWEEILEKNRMDRDSLAVFRENISFSSGAQFAREYSTDTMRMTSFQYNHYFNADFALGAKIINQTGIWKDTEGGIMGKFRRSTNINEGDDTTSTTKVGYVLDDNDIGDFFSVDILEDTSYSVPAFRLKLGTTSCPQEPGTQARDRASINILPPELTNVTPGEPANFVCQVTNESESFETREYAVRLISTTNPDGLTASLAGQGIVGGEATFFLEPFQTMNMNLSFEKGPLASTYENIGIMVYPLCEYELWQDNGTLRNVDTAWISRIEWQTECTNIALHLPDDGWLVNQQSDNIIHAALTGYDLYNPLFEFMTLQIRKEGEGYVDQVVINKDDITGPFHDVFLDVTNFEDGNYRLRAKAYCGMDGGVTYSSEKSGTIDRSSIAPFGIPTPSDGFLREGQEVSVTFDKNINCNLNSYPNEIITLKRVDNDQPIPFSTQCLNNKLIINATVPLLEQQDLDGVLVNAYVANLRDLNGNVQEYPTDWSFLVNVSPVFWDPKDLHVYGNQGQHNIITAVLKNTSLLSKPFSLDKTDHPVFIDYPVWLTPVQTHGTILSNNDFNVMFDVSDDLTPGIYSGIISAMIDSLPVSMNLTFELLAKPVSWNFDPSQYQYTMNMVMQFSLDGTNTNLSTDTRDLIGAFVNGQVRGITNIEYLPEIDQYLAFLTIYSNNQGGQGGETVKFKYWRALTGVEYGALESTPFTLDNTIGSENNPFILHPEGFFQIIPLAKGWNWISLNVSTTNMSRDHIFENILNGPGNNSLTIKSKTQSTQYSPQTGWSGNLQNLQLGAGYLVHLSNAPDTLKVVGLPSANTILINVAGNWNWIGFPRLNPESIDDVLDDLTLTQGNVLKSQEKFAAYNATLESWIGNLNFFQPGEGYKLFLTNPGTLVFEPSRSDEYTFDPYLYEYNMNVTGYADLSLIGEQKEEDFIIGAFIDGECRGTGVMEWNEPLRQYRIILLVNGNIADLGKQVEFKLKNEKNGNECISNGHTLYFTADGLFGSMIDPYLFFLLTTGVHQIVDNHYYLEQSRPNPANQHTVIGFHIPATQHVVITLFDINGNKIKTLTDGEYTEGRHTVQVDLSMLPLGVYLYDMQTTEFSATKKLIRQ